LTEAAASPGCGLTVLRCIGSARATKEWSWNAHLREWRKVSYQAGAWFAPTEHKVANLGGLVDLLDGVRRDPRAFVVRGALTEAIAASMAADPEFRIRRRKHKKGDVEPSLEEVPRSWAMIDIDNWPLRPMDDPADDPEAAIDHAISELLPEPFQEAECWWQLSSSAGFVPGYLKAHLFFWLSEPATNAHIKAVLEQHAPGVDRAPFSAAQPHFIADPIINNGHDPLPRRTGWRKGVEPVVVLPMLEPRVQRPRPAGTGAGGRVGSLGDALALLGHGEGGQGFHAPLRTATMRYALDCSRVRVRVRDDEAIKDFLRDAIRNAPCRPGGDVEHPYCEDFYLQSLIDGAFALLAGDPEIQSMRPHHQAATHTLDQAREALKKEAAGFFGRLFDWNALDEAERKENLPEHSALKCAVGTGKTTVTRAEVPSFLATSKAAGQPHRLLWLVPTHKLASETLDGMRDLGISAEIMQGRERPDPEAGKGDDGEAHMPMCRNLDAVRDAISIHANVESSVCGNPKKGLYCPWRAGSEQCGFQRQKGPVSRADVVIMAHQGMFTNLPKKVRTGLAGVIVDESWWQAGLPKPREVHLDSFAQEPLTYPVREQPKKANFATNRARRNTPNDEDTNDLHAWSALAQRAFEATADGQFPSRDEVGKTGLTAANCASAYTLEWRRMYEGAIYPGQPAEERRKAMLLAAGNTGIPRRAAIWRALQALIEGDDTHTGRLQIGTRTTASGTRRVILLHSRQEIRDEIAGLPMLHLDATMPLQIVRYYLPRIELLAEINPVTPHMEVHQVIGGWGKNSIVPSEKAGPEENRRRKELVSELADFAALNSGGNALVVTYQDIEPVFAERPEIRTGHFNAIAGLDVFKDVRSLFVIGRPLPDARELRETALALTGRAIPEEAGQVETRGALMEDGTGAAMNVRAYSDPDLEALRVAITEAEIVQAVGRGRGVKRTADNPLSVFLFADVATALPITRMARWTEIRPGVVARMASHGLVLASATDARRIYPDLFTTAEAAKKALQREMAGRDLGDIPLGIIIPRGMSPKSAVEVSYRPEGRGQQTRRALVTEERLPTLGAWLTEALGTKVHVQPVSPGTDPEPPRTPLTPPSPASTDDDRSPYDDVGQPDDADWGTPSWALEQTDEELLTRPPETSSDRAPSATRLSDEKVSPHASQPSVPLVCDVPWLHADAPAYLAPDGGVVLPRCPFCGEQHRHGGFGHRLAHCAEPMGRGYVLRPVGPAPPGPEAGWPLGP